MQLSITPEHPYLAVGRETVVHALVEIVAPAPAVDTERPPARVALVLDRSGSMGQLRKLDAARRCAAWLAEHLRPQDELALVDFDDRVRLLLPLGRADGRAARAALAGVRPGGATNLSAGWLRGLEQLLDTPRDGSRRILLLTDGLANRGLVARGALEELARNARTQGVSTSTIGFGGDFDEDLLSRMADAGGGTAHFAETADDAPRIFAEELGGLASVVAQNLRLDVRVGPGVRFDGVLNDLPLAQASDGVVTVEVGDAYGGTTRALVLRFVVGDVGSGRVEIAGLSLRSTPVADGEAGGSVETFLTCEGMDAGDARVGLTHEAVRAEVLAQQAADTRRAAIELADKGQMSEAASAIGEMLRDLEAAGLTDQAAALRADAQELQHYDALARKRIHYSRERISKGPRDSGRG